MADSTLTVEAGVCKFKTIVSAEMDDSMNISFRIKSECPAVREMAKAVTPIMVFDAISMPFSENVIYKDFASKLQHVACPVPCAMVKAAEVAGDMALKKPVTMTFE